MRTMKSAAAILGMAAMFGGLGDMPITGREQNLTKGCTQGWGNPKSKKVLRWRKKERAAKQARKLNWN